MFSVSANFRLVSPLERKGSMAKLKTKLTLLSMALLSGSAVCGTAFAASVPNASSVLSTFGGQARMYEFDRIHNGNSNAVPANTSAFALSTLLYGQTKSLYGFSAGLGVYAVSNLGWGPQSLAQDRDLSLMGSKNTFATPGQAFIQYANHYMRIRIGNQLVRTPWVNPSDSRMIPATFQGYTASITPYGRMAIQLGYIKNWKNRTNSGFDSTNLYGVQTNGFSYVGIRYPFVIGANRVQAQGWYYHFNDIANLTYLQGNYQYRTNMGIDPVAAIQYARETGAGSRLLGQVDSTVEGALVGAKIDSGTYTIAYDNIPSKSGDFENGNIVTPYTYQYATDPLFTTSMIEGLADQSTTGHAWKAKAVYWMGHKTWRIIGSYARYSQAQFLHTNQNGNPYEVDLGATYFIRHGKYKGLSFRGRVGDFTYSGAPANFVYARLQAQYNF